MRVFTILLVGVVIGAGALFAYQAWVEPNGAGVRDADDKGRAAGDKPRHGRSVVALGRIEPAGGVISIGALLGDQVKTLMVSEGDSVIAGQPLAELESLTVRQIERRSVESRLAEAKARRTAEEALASARVVSAELALKQAEGGQVGIEAQNAQVDFVREQLLLARKNEHRVLELPDDLASLQEREQQSLLVQQAEAGLRAAEAKTSEMQQTQRFAVAAAKSDLEAARAAREQVTSAIPVASLEQQLRLAQQQEQRATVVAPAAGTVLKIFAHDGELITNRPILQMADLSRMAVVVEVYKDDVKWLAPGQRAWVRSKAFTMADGDEQLSGTVTRVGRTIAGAELRDLDPFAQTDLHVVEIYVELDTASSREAARFVNMQVSVEFPAEPEQP